MMKPSIEFRQNHGLLLRSGLTVIVTVCFGFCILALLLIVTATKVSSQFFGWSILVTMALTGWWALAKRLEWRSLKLGVVIPTAVVAVSLYALAVWQSPSGHGSSQSRLTSIYRGSARYNHFSPAWIVDEADQVRLGGLVLPYLDPLSRGERGRHFAETFNATYAELDRSPDFVQIGSTMAEPYADMLFGGDSVGHAYVYRPAMPQNKRCPVIVFLHGWLGNMKPYIWNWARFADQHGFVVICPTFNNGLWQGPGADETLHWIDDVIHHDSMCNAQQVFVVGLSNGGTGATRWATLLPDTYRGLVMVSPVMEGTDSSEFATSVGSRPILVVHGGKDNRIPTPYVDSAVARMKINGLHVQSICYPEEDHILILSSTDRLQLDLFAWIEKINQEPTTLDLPAAQQSPKVGESIQPISNSASLIAAHSSSSEPE